MSNNLIEIINNMDNVDYDYMIVNIKKELDNFVFVDVVDKKFFDKFSLKKIENINKDLNRIFCVNYNYYKNDILKGFNSNEEITKQFNGDINRCRFSINNKIINNVDINELKELIKENYNEFILFCNQALYGLPCQYIQNSIINQNLFIGNYNNNENNEYNLQYNLDSTNNNLLLTSSKKLKIIQVFKNDLTVILNVIIKIHIDLKKKDNILIEFESSI